MEVEKRKRGPKEFDLSRVNQNLIPHILRKLKWIDLYHMRATCKRINEISLEVAGYCNPTPLTLSIGAEYIEKVPIMHRYYGGRNKMYTVRYCVKRIRDEAEFLNDCKIFNIQFRRVVFFDGLTQRLGDLLFKSNLVCKKLSLTGHYPKTIIEMPRFEYLNQTFRFLEFVMEKPAYIEVTAAKILKFYRFRRCPNLTLKFNDVRLENIYETFKFHQTICLFSELFDGINAVTAFIKEVQRMDTAPFRLERITFRTRCDFSRFNFSEADRIILLHREKSLVEAGKSYKKVYLSRTTNEYLVISAKIEELSGIKPIVDFIENKLNLLRRFVELIDWRKNINETGLNTLWQDFETVEFAEMPGFVEEKLVPMSIGI